MQVVRHHRRVVIGQQNVVAIECIHAGFQFSRKPDVILVAKRNQVRTAQVGGVHKIGLVAKLGRVAFDAHGKRRRGGEGGDARDGLVGRTIIGDDEFSRQKGLGGKTRQLAGDLSGAVMRRHGDGYGTWFHRAPFRQRA